MSRTKCTVDFDGVMELARKLDKLAGHEFLKKAIEKSLIESKNLVNAQLHEAMKAHRRTGQVEASIRDDAKPQWNGGDVSISVGFDIYKGGLPSIFLMYGTPTIPKDQKLYNAVYGQTTKRKVRELQEKIFSDALKEAMGG